MENLKSQVELLSNTSASVIELDGDYDGTLYIIIK